MRIFLSAFLSLLLASQPLYANLSPLNAENSKSYLKIFKNAGVTDGAFFSGSDLVIWVQDLHLNAQTQKIITSLTDEIIAGTGSAGIYAEGMLKGQADVSVLADIPDEINKEKSINYLYGKGFLSAAEYMALKGYHVYGVEDEELYSETLSVLEKLIKNKDKKSMLAAALSEKLKALKRRYLSKSALKFNAKFEKKYHKILTLETKKAESLLPYYPNLNTYVNFGLQNRISSRGLNDELLLCLNELKNNVSYIKYSAAVSGLNPEDDGSMMNLYEILLSDAPKLLEKYPRLNGFFIKRKELLRINKVELVFEELSFAKELSRANSSGFLDEELLSLEEAVTLLKDYAVLAVNGSQYGRLKDSREYYDELINKYFEGRLREFALELLYDSDREMFYENNILRDKVFCLELLAGMRSSASVYKSGPVKVLENLKNYKNVKIIIAGGFHYGIKEFFEDKKISYLILTPEVKSAEKQNKYDDFILYGTNAFNKVFHSDFDFGSPDKVLNAFVSVAARWGGYSVSARQLQAEMEKWISSNKKLSGISVSVSAFSGGYKVAAAYKGASLTADIAIKNSQETEVLNRKTVSPEAEKYLNETEEENGKEQDGAIEEIKPLSLIDPFLKTRAQKLFASMFMPAAESLLWLPMIAALPAASVAALIMPFAFAFLHNIFKAAALKTDGKKYAAGTFVSDFAGYFIPSAGLSAATSLAFWACSFITANPAAAILVALIANICAHYAYEIYRLSGGTLYKGSEYFTKLAEKYSGDARKLHMIEALKEAETARVEQKEIKTFLKPPVGAFIIDGDGNKGRGFNRENSLLHAEYFAVISYLASRIDKYERDDTGEYTQKGIDLLNLLNAAVINAETLGRRVFERNPYLLEAAGFEAVYPKIRTIDDVFNETNLIFKYVNLELGNPLSEASLYCTLAPCNKCSKMMSFIKIKELVFASSSINKSHKGKDVLRDAGVRITENVLAEEAEEYVENYKIANKTPLRTKLASFIQTVSREIKSLFDFASADVFNSSDFMTLFRRQSLPSFNIYDNMLYGRPDKVVVRIASSLEQYFSSLENERRYAGGGVEEIVFTRLGFEDDRFAMTQFASVFTAKDADAKAKALFKVYVKNKIFYVDIVSFNAMDENRAYELAYARLFKELKEGVLSPSVNPDVRKLLGLKNIDIIAAEGSFDGQQSAVLSNMEEYGETSANSWGRAENIEKYKMFVQMRSEAEELKGRFRESERVETRSMLTGSSVGINIASLSAGEGIGKIKDILRFVNVIKGKFRALNISGYMPFGKTSWLDDIYIDWIGEALRLSGAGYDISEEEIGGISNFYAGLARTRKEGIDNESAAEIRSFEEETAKRLLAKVKHIPAANISESELRAYRDAVKEMQITEIVAKAGIEGVDISAEYVYDVSLSAKENLESISKILALFNGIIIRLNAQTLKEISGDIYRISYGKPVAFRLDESDPRNISEADSLVQKDYGFRVVREFSYEQDPYGKVISVPAEKINDTVLEKLGGSSAVIISVPATAGNVIERLSDIKNGESIISNIMKAAGNIRAGFAEKNVSEHYFYGINISRQAGKTAGNELFGQTLVINSAKGRGLLAALNALDSDIADETVMPEIFEAIKTAASFADIRTQRRISVITDKIKKQYENADGKNKRIAVESLKQFLFGLYFNAEIMALPAFEKFEGEYAQRAGNYAADARKHIIDTETGLAFDDTLSGSLKSVYLLLCAGMLSKDEIMKLLNHYSAVVRQSGDRQQQMLFAVVLGYAAKKHGKAETLKYLQGIKDKITSYQISENDKALHLSALASISYIANDGILKNAVKDDLKDGGIAFAEYDFNNMLMTVTLIELLDFNPGLFVFDKGKDAALEKIYSDSALAGLYAKTAKLTSSYSVSGIEAELESALESFIITPMKRYSVTGDNVKAASMAMALIELCELAGYKNDAGNLKKTAKTTSISAIKSILSAA